MIAAAAIALVALHAGSSPEVESPAAGPTGTPSSAPADEALARHALAFGDHLFGDGDFYRAITEYRRYLFLTQGAGEEAFRVALAIGEAYLRGGQTEAAAAQFESVARRSVDPSRRAVAILSAGRAHLLGGQPMLAASRLAEAREVAAADQPVADEALFLLGWARVALDDYESAQSAFEDLARRQTPRGPDAQRILTHLAGRPIGGGKNPLLAGALSLVPGLGHIYLGQWAIGLTALFWNGLFGFATAYSAWTQQWGVAAVLAVFELTWYTGTMFGALNGAFRYNQDLERNWHDELDGALGASRGLEPVRTAPGAPGTVTRLIPGGGGGDG